MASIKSLKVNDVVYNFQFNNNNQYSGVVDENGALVPKDKDPVLETLRDMERYNDGETYKKPQPKVKIDGVVIKLGDRYFTDEERAQSKTYTDTHSKSGVKKSTLLAEKIARLKDYKACIAEINDEKLSAPILKLYEKEKAQLIPELDDTTKKLIEAGIIEL